MGRPKQFRITFNSPTGVYYGGQMVQGTITLELDKPLTMRALRVEYQGQATVHWKEEETRGKTTYTVVHHNEQHYFKGSEDLWTKGKAGSDEMPRGLHTFPFQFTIPPGVPCSFEGGVGHVRYSVKSVIDRRFHFDINVQKALTVISDLDLNTIENILTETKCSKHKFICCLCCRSGPISATLQIPRRGYVPGEVIPINAEIENLSRRTMAKTTAKIYQLIYFHAQRKTRIESKKVAELRHGQILPGGSDQWHAGTDRLLIPPVPPSYLAGCNIIDVLYCIQLSVVPTGLGLPLDVVISFTIGTIPLKQVMQQNSNFSMQPPSASVPTRDQICSSTTPNVGTSSSLPPAMPPPQSYSESVFGKVNITEDDDDKENAEESSYAPVYTYYNWGFESSANNP